MYVGTYVRMYVCMYVYIYIYVCVYINISIPPPPPLPGTLGTRNGLTHLEGQNQVGGSKLMDFQGCNWEDHTK